MEKMFEYATRKRFRFPFKGLISVEDLWDLSMANLDSIFKTLNALNKVEKNEESLMVTKSEEDSELDMKIEIIRYIYGVKKAEADARKDEKERKERKQQLMAIKAKKQNEALENMSVEDIDKMIAELE